MQGVIWLLEPYSDAILLSVISKQSFSTTSPKILREAYEHHIDGLYPCRLEIMTTLGPLFEWKALLFLQSVWWLVVTY